MSDQLFARRQQVRQTSMFADDDNVYVDPDDNALFTSTTSLNTSSNDNSSLYTMNYRVVKTALLVTAWISFGLNYEMIGPTFEDLKVYLAINYSMISFGLVLRNFGYLTLSLVFGALFDRISKFSELFMAIASVVIGISKINKNRYKTKE
jgi:fucose permease